MKKYDTMALVCAIIGLSFEVDLFIIASLVLYCTQAIVDAIKDANISIVNYNNFKKDFIDDDDDKKSTTKKP